MTYDPNVRDPAGPFPTQVSNQPTPRDAPAGALVPPMDIPGQPKGTHSFPAQVSAQLLEDPPELTADDLAKVDELYEELKPEATETARSYVLNRTPALYQEAMAAKIEADWPLPPAEDQALTDSRMHDRDSYKRAADQPNANPNLDPNVQYQQPAYQR